MKDDSNYASRHVPHDYPCWHPPYGNDQSFTLHIRDRRTMIQIGILVRPTDTISYIKEHIATTFGMPFAQQELLFGNRLLVAHASVRESQPYQGAHSMRSFHHAYIVKHWDMFLGLILVCPRYPLKKVSCLCGSGEKGTNFA